MVSSFWKVVPILTLGLGASAAAQDIAAKSVKAETAYQTAAMARGVNEGSGCFARSCANCYGAAMEWDFLYWRAENHGLSYAVDQKDSRYSVAGSYLNADIKRIDPKWKPGFRFGLGYNSNYDKWDLFANWTWYTNHSNEHHNRNDIAAGSYEGYYPMWPVDMGSNPYRSVHASWHLRHNVFDLELGRAYYITKQLSLRPHWGLRGGWLNQQFSHHFTSPVQTESRAYGRYSEDLFHAKNNWWGVGPRIGLHADWHIANSSWSVLGKASTSLLYGKTNIKYNHEYVWTDGLLYPERQYHDNFSQLVPHLQLFLGLNWGSCLDNNKYYLGVNAGWEANYWWDQCNLPIAAYYAGGLTAPLPTTGNQPVTMEGLTVDIHFDF